MRPKQYRVRLTVGQPGSDEEPTPNGRGGRTMMAYQLEALLRLAVEPDAKVHRMSDHGGYGLVVWSHEDSTIPGGREWVTHRWAVTRTDGSPIEGGMFWSGGYHLTEADACADFNDRA